MADENFDDKLRTKLEADLEGLVDQLRQAMSAEVSTKITEPCEKCGCKHFRYAKTPDWKTKLAIADFLSNRGYGRPGQAETESDSEKIIFKRLVVMEDDGEDA